MSTDLQTYKQQEIAKVTTQYNADIAKLRASHNQNVKKIQSARMHSYNKRRIINNLRVNLQSLINKLKRQLNIAIAKINALQQVPRTTPSKFALLVGINYKGSPYQLNGCINDVLNVKNVLENNYGYTNILVLSDDTNKQPTKQNIINEFTNMLKNSISGDNLFFQYSGHGSYTFDQSGDEKDGRDETIVPIDYVDITDDEIRSILITNLKPGVRLFALFDSCHSGTVMDLRYNYLDSQNLNNLTTNTAIAETVGQVQMISGCLDNQTSADASFIVQGTPNYQGAMTNAFLASLQPNILLRSLIENMRTTLKNGKFSQIPQLSCGMPIDILTEVFEI